jgi:hypothetical protein
MNVSISDKIINTYFQYIKNWDMASKKQLAIKLISSIESDSKERFDFSSCFGRWKDERSADEIIGEIKADRINRDETEEF